MNGKGESRKISIKDVNGIIWYRGERYKIITIINTSCTNNNSV